MQQGCTFYIHINGTVTKMTDQCEGRCTAPDPAEHQAGAIVFVPCDAE
jgi:hypothetical protein